jgi:hypothetical protein
MGNGLPEAAVSLSTARLPRVAAAVAAIFELQPHILEEQPELDGPGFGTPEIPEKGPGAGADFGLPAHGRGPGGLALGLDIPGITGDHVQFDAVVQFFLGGGFGAFDGVQRAEPLVAVAVLDLEETFSPFRGFRHENLQYLHASQAFGEDALSNKEAGWPPPAHLEQNFWKAPKPPSRWEVIANESAK